MFVDYAKISVKAGDGGNGIVAWRREKYVPAGGPDGGDGGNGASVYVMVDEGLRTLMDFRYQKSYVASHGEHGRKKKQTGKNGEDLYIKVPQGTIVKDERTGKILADLRNKGDVSLIAKGGKGGRGNPHFTNSVRQAPNFAEQGRKGIERTVILELKMIADVGLIGFPNVGKSSLLAKTTAANPKIANYHFTTLQPNLGVVEAIKGKSFVMADIPGLIEGAKEGVGLGHNFLRHIERTRLFLHVVDVSGIEGRDPVEDFDLINNELKGYSEILMERRQVVIANKTDLLFDDEKLAEFKATLEGRGFKVFAVSAATGDGVAEVMKYVTELLDEIPVFDLYEEEEYYTEEDELFESGEAVIEVIDDVYVVSGESIERLLYSTNFEDIESLRRFQTILKQRNIFERMKEMGIEDGDLVKIFDFEFEYYE